MFFVLYVFSACTADDIKSHFMWDVNFKHAPHEKVLTLRCLVMITVLKFYVLHFSVWEDLWHLQQRIRKSQELGLRIRKARNSFTLKRVVAEACLLKGKKYYQRLFGMVFLLKIPKFSIFLDLDNMKIFRNNVQLGWSFR